MMLYPPMGDLMDKVGSRYLLVNMVARRAREISDEAEEEGIPLDEKTVSLAINEAWYYLEYGTEIPENMIVSLFSVQEANVSALLEHGIDLDDCVGQEFLFLTSSKIWWDGWDLPIIEVTSAEEQVAVQSKHLVLQTFHAHDRHIKRAASQIVDHNCLLIVALHVLVRVGIRSSNRLGNNCNHIQASDDTRILGRLALTLIEVCGDSDDNFIDITLSVLGCQLLKVTQDHCFDFLRTFVDVLPILDHPNHGLVVSIVDDGKRDVLLHLFNNRIRVGHSDQTLTVKNDASRVYSHLVASKLSNHVYWVSVWWICNIGRNDPASPPVRNHLHLAVPDDSCT